MNATEYVRHIKLYQQCSVFVHVTGWPLKYVISGDEYSQN